jgi:hypothetical protein
MPTAANPDRQELIERYVEVEGLVHALHVLIGRSGATANVVSVFGAPWGHLENWEPGEPIGRADEVLWTEEEMDADDPSYLDADARSWIVAARLLTDLAANSDYLARCAGAMYEAVTRRA